MISAIGALFKSSEPAKDLVDTEQDKEKKIENGLDEKHGINVERSSTEVVSTYEPVAIGEQKVDTIVPTKISPSQTGAETKDMSADSKTKTASKSNGEKQDKSSKSAKSDESKSSKTSKVVKKTAEETVKEAKSNSKSNGKTVKKAASNGQDNKEAKTSKSKTKEAIKSKGTLPKAKSKSKAKSKAKSKSKKEASSSSESESESESDDEDESDSDSDDDKKSKTKAKAKPKAKPSPKKKAQAKVSSAKEAKTPSKSSKTDAKKITVSKPVEKPQDVKDQLKIVKASKETVSDKVATTQDKVAQVIPRDPAKVDDTRHAITHVSETIHMHTDDDAKHADKAEIKAIDANKMDETPDQPTLMNSVQKDVTEETKPVAKESEEKEPKEKTKEKEIVKAKPAKRKRESIKKEKVAKSDKPAKNKQSEKKNSGKKKAKRPRVTFQDTVNDGDKNKPVEIVKVTEPTLQSLCLSHLAKSVNATSMAIVTMLGRYHPMTLISNTFSPLNTCVARTETEYKKCHDSPCTVHKEVPKTVPRDVNLFINTISDCVNTLSNVESLAKHPQADDQLKVVQEMTRLYESVQYSYIEIKDIIQRVCVATLQALIQIVPTDSSDARAARKILVDR